VRYNQSLSTITLSGKSDHLSVYPPLLAFREDSSEILSTTQFARGRFDFLLFSLWFSSPSTIRSIEEKRKWSNRE
jgi:hypothetical protein